MATPATDSNPSQVRVQNEEELQKIFNQFDANGDGLISLEELGGVLKAMGSSYTCEELQRVMDDLDTDKDGFINLPEFAAFCSSSSSSNNETELHDAFDLYDANKNGLISKDELHLVLNKLGMKCTIDDCVRMIQTVDSDGDGFVNFEEFRKMMNNSVSNASGP